MIKARLSELQLAIMLLTRLPAGRIEGDAPSMLEARWAFPLVGALIGALTWVAHVGAVTLGAPSLVAALLALVALALVTGALHFDGLADFADGIGGGRDKAHALEIMRDSRVGSYGMLAVVLVAGLWAASVAHAAPGVLAFVGAAVLSRSAMVGLQEFMPSARSDGLGQQASGHSPVARGVILAVAVLGLLIWPKPFVVCIAVICLIGWMAQRKIGGQTGDVLGAGQLATETAIWVALSAA